MEPVLESMLALLRHYVERQYIVFRALQDLRPNFFIDPHSLQYVVDLPSYQLGFKAPQIGYWGENNEWKYFLHGLGCWLTHTITREPIDWDVPNPQVLDLFFFSRHLQWRMEYHADHTDVAIVANVFRQQDESLLGSLEMLMVALHQHDHVLATRPNSIGLGMHFIVKHHTYPFEKLT